MRRTKGYGIFVEAVAFGHGNVTDTAPLVHYETHTHHTGQVAPPILGGVFDFFGQLAVERRVAARKHRYLSGKRAHFRYSRRGQCGTSPAGFGRQKLTGTLGPTGTG